jgi:hypothetical protein
MSIDIYCFVEVRRDGGWEKVGRVFPNPAWAAEVVEYHPEEGWVSHPLTDRPYRQRNYDVFSLLAGVGPADVEPIVRPAPRGLPHDASPELAKYGQAHSWLTLEELQAYDWDGPGAVRYDWDDPTFKSAWEDYNGRRVAAGKKPADWLDPRDPELPIPPLRMHTRRELAGEFVTETMPLLANLGAPEDVRIIVSFY